MKITPMDIEQQQFGRSFRGYNEDEVDNFLDSHPKNIELIKTKVHSNLQKGDVVLFHCKTLHHASKNNTDKAKISFVYTVRANSNKPTSNTRSDFKEVILD